MATPAPQLSTTMNPLLAERLALRRQFNNTFDACPSQEFMDGCACVNVRRRGSVVSTECKNGAFRCEFREGCPAPPQCNACSVDRPSNATPTTTSSINDAMLARTMGTNNTTTTTAGPQPGTPDYMAQMMQRIISGISSPRSSPAQVSSPAQSISERATTQSPATGDYINLNLTDEFISTQNVNELIQNIRDILTTENIQTISVLRHYQNNYGTTTTSSPQTSDGTASAPLTINQLMNTDLRAFVTNLTLDDVRVLFTLLMGLDLDQNRNPDIFQLLMLARNILVNQGNYQTSQQLYSDVNRYRNREPSETLRQGLMTASPNTYRQLFVPGFSMTDPETWQDTRTPVCRPDSGERQDPAFVISEGAPANALELGQDNLMPQFIYQESQSTPEFLAMRNENIKKDLCSMYCHNSCDYPICRNIGCASCSRT